KFYILVQNYANLTVSGMTLDGTYLDKYAFTDGDSYTLSNNCGNVTVNGKSNIIANNDGALAFAFDACKNGSYTEPVVTVDATCTIAGNIEAVKVDKTYYATLASAIENAKAGQTVTLMSDITLTEKDVVKTDDDKNVMALINKNLTLDLNGHTINVNYDNNELLYAVVYVEDGVTATVKDSVGNGGIDVKTGDTLAGQYDCVAYMFWKRGTTGRLNISGGNFHANKLEDSIAYTNVSYGINVSGGKFVLDNVGTGANGSPWIFNAEGRNEKKITVTGGTFNADVFHQYWIFEINADKSLALKDNGDGTYTVVDAVAYVNEQHFSSKWYTKNVGYATLDEAIAAVKPQQTVTIGKNVYTSAVEEVVFLQDIVIDAKLSNGYGATGIIVNGQVINGNGYSLTVNKAGNTWDSAIFIKSGTVKNLTVKKAFRGIFTSDSANGDIYLDNVAFGAGVVYTFNSDGKSSVRESAVYISNSKMNGWTSFSDTHTEVVFTNCSFGLGNGYQFCRPYNATSFVDCAFDAGFKVDSLAASSFENCTIAGEALTAENLATLVTSNTANATVK
ncbi:MAG: hypothetical protein IKY17_07330, partial [Oscillospiraceae bacterium]|nr:hypothetical protein [Oscillospiraceae bacterium]